MYKCRTCNNTTRFVELNESRTYLVIDRVTREIVSAKDKHSGCIEVICQDCESSSRDGIVLTDSGETIDV